MAEDAVVAGVVEEEAIVEVGAVTRSVEAEAGTVQRLRDPVAGQPASARLEAGNGLNRQPDPGEAWVEVEDIDRNNVLLRVRVEDRAAAEGPVVEVPAACRAWEAVGKGPPSVRISIAPGRVQVLVRDPVPVLAQVKGRVLALGQVKAHARARVPERAQA